jgi:pyruvate/2-oxoglutarate dehydrogenase complex dihydrolipoamide acyltransferase (E2) component
MAIQVVMPEMGEGVIEGTVSQWLKQEGEQVEEFEPILEIETDKVTTEATAEAAGTCSRYTCRRARRCRSARILALIGEPGETAPDDPSDALEEGRNGAGWQKRRRRQPAAGRSNGGRTPVSEPARPRKQSRSPAGPAPSSSASPPSTTSISTGSRAAGAAGASPRRTSSPTWKRARPNRRHGKRLRHARFPSLRDDRPLPPARQPRHANQ